jgi:hypothetical protein
MPILGKKNREIRSMDDWSKIAGPKRADQWQSCRSAKELARSWVGGNAGPAVPHELARLLSPLLPEGVPGDWVAFAERRVLIDRLDGEPPNIDLAISFRRNDRKPVAVCIEAKADEEFRDLVSVELTNAAKRIARDETTYVMTRIQSLAQGLLPPWRDGLAHLGELRYQLLTGVAGTLAFAELEGAEDAAFVVHEFVCANELAQEKLARNQQDLNRFVSRLSGGKWLALNAGEFIGPVTFPGSVPRPRLYLGKIRREVSVPPA